MITEELLEFLRTQYASGMSAEEIEQLLVTEGGWNKEDVEEAFRQVGITPMATSVVEPVPLQATPTPAEPSAPADLPIETETPSEAPTIEPVTPPLQALTPDEKEEPTVLTNTPPLEQLIEPQQIPVDTPKQEPEEMETPSLDQPVSTPDKAQDAGDDFLGIFSAPEAPVAPASIQIEQGPVSTPAPAPAPVVVESPIAPIEIPGVSVPDVETTVAPAPTPVAPTGNELALDDVKKSIADIAQQVPGVTIAAPSTPPVKVETAPLVFGKKPEWSFQDMLAQKGGEKKEEATTVSEPASVVNADQQPTPPKSVQFDLSRLEAKKDTPPTIAAQYPDPTRPTGAPVVKPVETRSVAEVWLSGVNPDAKEPVPYTSSTPRSGLNARRTMNSDLLLRGKGGLAGAAIPSISEDNLPSPVAMPEIPPPPPEPAPVKRSPVVSTESSISQSVKNSNQFKRIAGVVVGVLVLAGLVWGMVSYIIAHQGPSLAERFALSLNQFVAQSSFSYSGEGFLDLKLSTSQGGVERNGVVKFTLKDTGSLNNSASGFGDGAHRVKVAGTLQSGTYLWNTDLESDVLLIGNNLFFHLLAYPATSDFDPAVVQTYWVKVDLDALAKELALSGVSSGGAGYGNFGASGKSESAFSNLYAKNLPFVVDETLPEETIAGVNAMHIKLKADPERMLTFALALYKKYSGSDLLLTADQQLRLKNALAKVTGEVWLDPTTQTLLKFKVRGDFDDDMVSAHVKGSAQFEFSFADQGKVVTVVEPTPFLTLEEFRARREEYVKNKELRAGDIVKINGLQKIVDALTVYYKEKGRYPAVLVDLRTSGKLPASVLDEYAFKTYSYAAYVKPEQLTKAGRCPTKGKTCAFYHLGVSFEDLTNPALATDADVTSDVLGKDNSGCLGEPNVSCFDVVSTSLTPAPVATSTAATSTAR